MTRRTRSVLTAAVAVMVVLVAFVIWVQRQGYVSGATPADTSTYPSTSGAAGTASVDPETGLRWIEVTYLPSQDGRCWR